MDEQKFWQLVESSKTEAKGSFDGHVEALSEKLADLPAEEIAAFERIFREKSVRAYSWDLWGAAYVMNGGCSDDGVTDFRSWLISLGRDRYERALQDPESLADVEFGPGREEDAAFEEFAYVAERAYEEKTGTQIPDDDPRHPHEPRGEPFEEDTDALAARYPKLFAKHGD